MEAWSSVLIALLLFLAAGWLIDSHLRTWRKVQKRRHELEPNELKKELDRWGLFEEYEDRFFTLFKKGR